MMKLEMNSGNTAEQVESQEMESTTDSLADKLKAAYVTARTQLEITEVELNRSKIMMVDENGKMTKVSILSEH
ncbi:conserved hypothetical protein [Vibrio jasicida]|jgi:ABC-type phosphate transport system auxiliary subunit|uniref:Uncharacterized protein n=3 Tax=Vibrio jasicida TaxID=766224 RepID=A0AAU9QWT8_9VIBR|nr:hypothetical protein [Vibrio jasicida]PAW08504.1 hypothetical protein B6K85_22105 [Vibrio sp. V1B]CAH1525107.1 conserved hypothetical protein [Vibrio jasicida]CAH1602335.1 conserved hypothetical protein [Vibrio jasicida]CAH1603432.1 conserved hypothetical protein [Vibrio jasicida]